MNEIDVDRDRRNLCHDILAVVHEHGADSEDAIGALFDAAAVIYLAEIKIAPERADQFRTYVTGDLDLALSFCEGEAAR